MLASELIARLSAQIAEFGDRRVVFVLDSDSDNHTDPDTLIEADAAESSCSEDCHIVFHK